MPVALRTRPYDEEFYKQITGGITVPRSRVSWEEMEPEEAEKAMQKVVEDEKDLFG
jgi:hypothetical protein